MVWRRLDVTGGELLLALAIADFSNSQGEGIWPSVETLCHLTRQGERTVRRQLARFRELHWLEVVKAGGLVGGRGRSTQYRINADWIKGAELAGFKDAAHGNYAEEKPANLAGLPGAQPVDENAKGCHPRHERVPSATVNPATAMAGNPSLPTNDPKSAPTRATPSGSRGAKTPEPAPYNPDERRAYWQARARGWVVTECRAMEITKYGEAPRFEDLPSGVRMVMPDKIEALVRLAIEWERPPSVKTFTTIVNHIEQELTLELRAFRPATVAERASAAA